MVSLEKITHFLPHWVIRSHHHRQLNLAIHKAYTIWAQRYPRWANAGFDEYFLMHDAMPLLLDMVACTQKSDAKQLAHKWATTYSMSQERVERAVTECTPVAKHFIALLQVEYAVQRIGYRATSPVHHSL